MPLRAAASISSTVAQSEAPGSSSKLQARWAAASALVVVAEAVAEAALAHSANVTPTPSPRRVTSWMVASIRAAPWPRRRGNAASPMAP